MEQREVIGYVLILLSVAAVAAMVLYARYNSPEARFRRFKERNDRAKVTRESR